MACSSSEGEYYDGVCDEVIYLNVGGAGASTVLDAHRGVLAVKGAL